MRADDANAASVLGAAVRQNPPVKPAARPNDPIFIGVLLIVLVGVAKILLRRRLSSRHATSLDLVMVGLAFMLLLMMRLPLAGAAGLTGTLLFVGLAAVYKLLGYFEEPPDDKT